MTSEDTPSSTVADERKRAPVFVLGSPRSGTTLLYDMLLSAGGFAVYLAESNIFNLLAPRFGDFSSRATRESLLNAWLGSKLYRASGVDPQPIRQRVLEECRTPGDFLCIVMGEICRLQSGSRWAENSPEAILYLPFIKQQIPNALVIHIIRDGRDVANSLGQLQYVRPFPWERRYGVIGCGLYWEWIVRQGRQFGRLLGGDYIEVRFEELLANPQETLDRVGRFIEQPLDYETIQRVGYGSVSKPNTSFRVEDSSARFNPVGRWKTNFSADALDRFERLVGETLQELGYPLATAKRTATLSLKATRHLHRSFFAGKFWYKNNSWIRALRPALTGAEIDEIVLAENHPPVLKERPRRTLESGG
jgi:hypothetical protein